jgi:WD40 repeat protein
VTCTQLDGNPVALTGSWDHTLRIWDLTTGIPFGLLSGHTGRITAVTCTQLDGSTIAVTGSSDCTVRIWDFRTRLQTNRIDLPSDVKPLPASPRAASWSPSVGTLSFWNPRRNG